MIVDLKSQPALRGLIRAVAPKYGKHKALVYTAERATLHGTYWDGGSRTTYYAVNLATKHCAPAPQFAPPQFGGPSTTPEVAIPPGYAIIGVGTFCGKTATASVTFNPADATKMLEAA